MLAGVKKKRIDLHKASLCREPEGYRGRHRTGLSSLPADEHSTSDNTAELKNAASVAAVGEFTTEGSLQKRRAAQTKLVEVVRLGGLTRARVAVPSDS